MGGRRPSCSIRRDRKNCKNSTPSRKRRFIISGLTIISATMDAIYAGMSRTTSLNLPELIS